MRALHARNSHLTAASKHCRRESIRPRARQLVILEYDLLCIISVTQVKRKFFCFVFSGLFRGMIAAARAMQNFFARQISAKYNFT
jgi:hypothetical protein